MISDVVGALQTLPAQERAVVFLRDVLQWETRDVADLLRMHPDAVDRALQRARPALERTLRQTRTVFDDEPA